MNLRTLGREAGEQLIAMIAGQRFSGVRRLPCSLHIRDSCGGKGKADAAASNNQTKGKN